MAVFRYVCEPDTVIHALLVYYTDSSLNNTTPADIFNLIIK